MSHLVAALGPDAAPLLRASPWEGQAETNTTDPRGAFARIARPGDAEAENGGLFASPDRSCRGVLSGAIHGLERLLAPFPAELPHHRRLGLLFQSLLARHGARFPAALDGAFAVVVKQGDELYAARDAIGERPLYVLQAPGGSFVLADRLSPLLHHPGCGRRLDAGGIHDYLATGFCPFTRTPIEGLSSIPAGFVWRARAGGAARLEAFHELTDAPPATLDPAVAAAEVRRRLEQAVEQRFVPGRRTVLFLSGGLDSSLVGALLGGARIQAAWSLHFGPRFRNELEYSALVARHLGVPHRVLELSAGLVRDRFLDAMRVLDEPIGDPLTVPNYLLARAAAQDADVVFNGEGGDPLFGGPKNLPLLLATAYGGAAGQRAPEKLYLASYNKGYEHLPALLTGDFKARLAGVPGTAALLAPLLAEPRLHALLNRLMHVNLRLKGAGQILPKVFKAASHAGLQVRSPLFDRALAEYAFRLPPELKLSGAREKHVLKEAVRDLLPAVILERPKSGMLVPVEHWFRGELKGFARDLLLSRRARARGLFRPPALRKLLSFQGPGLRAFHGDRIWLLVSLEAWLESQGL